MTCPCRGCPDRFTACHDSCDRYHAWKAIRAEEIEALKALGTATRHIGERKAPRPQNRIGVWKQKTNK